MSAFWYGSSARRSAPAAFLVVLIEIHTLFPQDAPGPQPPIRLRQSRPDEACRLVGNGNGHLLTGPGIENGERHVGLLQWSPSWLGELRRSVTTVT
jgi:hypothetical protein